MIGLWILFIVGGFLLGSILFSKIIPRILVGKDVCVLSSDCNPGAANVFVKCGVKLGFLCLFLDMLKGFVPVFIASFVLNTESILFSLVISAPVLGHALGVFNRFHGGKCISTSFGIVLGLMPITRIGFLLAGLYILFSTAIRLRPHSLRSIISFTLFAVGAGIIMCVTKKYCVAVGCDIFSLIAVLKHIIAPNELENKEIKKEEASVIETN